MNKEGKMQNLNTSKKKREKQVSIEFKELGEVFEVEKRVAIPIVEALRVYSELKKNPESRSSDLKEIAKILEVLSEINY